MTARVRHLVNVHYLILVSHFEAHHSCASEGENLRFLRKCKTRFYVVRFMRKIIKIKVEEIIFNINRRLALTVPELANTIFAAHWF